MKLSNGVVEAFSSQSRVVEAVHSPLGFFVLALVIVEAFLILAGTLFGLPLPIREIALAIGVVLFILVIGCVYRLVVKYPRNLVFSERSHVAFQAMKIYGDNNLPLTRTDIAALEPAENPEHPVQQLPPGESES
jgi:hypothetical protein